MLAARWAQWEQRIAAADAACAAFSASEREPLPALALLRLALAGRRQGVVALAAGEPPAGLGPRLTRRLQRAARSWMRWRPDGAPDAAGELLVRAEHEPGTELGALVRGFIVAAHRQARRQRAKHTARLDAAHRRAQRRRAQLIAAWPAWLQRHGDQLVLDPGDRYLQVHRLPTPAELADPQLRRWLRAITALHWPTPAAALELTDRDGRYAYIPLDAARLQIDGDRTRGPWTSQQPRRRRALERARHAINARKARRRDR